MRSKTLIQLLEERKSAGRTGITFIEKSNQEAFLSYAELYERALQGLAFLQSSGLQSKEELVFQIDDNETFIITFWACILGGIIPVPLSIGQNDDHKQKLFNVWATLKHPHLISPIGMHSRLAAFAGLNGLEAVYADIAGNSIDEAGILASRREGHLFGAAENDIAFVQYSSGSTGSPKGVVLTHKNLLLNMEAISRAAQYSEKDSTMSWMPLTHDMGLIGFHLNPVFSGMNQYLMPTNLFIRRPALWLDKASEHKISVLCSPNFGYKYILKHCRLPDGHSWDLSGVRLLYNGAEPISERLCGDFLDELVKYGLKRQAMCPVYGLAEATLAVSISAPEDQVQSLQLDRNHLSFGDQVLITGQGDGAVTFVNVGRPVDYCSVRIADGNNGTAGEATIGHVQIKGSSVTSGYYNNQEATRIAIDADGWLDTGDLGFTKHGALYITGRAKDIIFVNGRNYYPHDIEQVAGEMDGIELNKIAVAGLFDEKAQQEQTVAFVFHRGSIAEFIPLMHALRAFLNSKIGFELDRIIPVKDIPRTTSGKLQRFQLLDELKRGSFDDVVRQLEQVMNKPATRPLEEPQNYKEQKLLGLWTGILKKDAIGVTQKFFEVGGNSLKAAELGMALRKAFGVELPLSVLYEKQTIRELAGAFDALDKGAYTPIPATRQHSCYPLTWAQKGIYYAWEADKASTAYNIPVAFTIDGQPEIELLEVCIRQLIRRHDALRMSFQPGLEPTFKVHDEIGFALSCTACPERELEEQLKGLVQPFDLTKAPLFRLNLLKADTSSSYVLFVDFHHIVSDGVSVYNFIGELTRLYASRELPVLCTGYKDYACWENENRQPTPVTERREAYWLNRLQGELPLLNMPLDFARSVVLNQKGEKIEFGVCRETVTALRKLAKANNCTLHALMFTLYKLLLWKYTGQDDIIIGIPVAGRSHPDLQGVLGMFVNNLVIRNAVNPDQSFTQLLAAEQENLVHALDNQEYPFGELVQKTAGKRNMSRNPVFDTMFIYQNMGRPGYPHPDCTLARHFLDPGFSKFDLSLEVFDDGDGLLYAFEYATSLFKRATIVNLAKHFDHLISRVTHQPDGKLSALSLLAGPEYDACIRHFNATRSSYPQDKTIDELFEEQAGITPERIAVVHGDQTMSYAQLNQLAGQLAALLREKGVTAGSVVGVWLQKSPALIVSILGVLKAGGAYVPISTDLPEDRIRYMVSDSGCRVVITDSTRALRAAHLRDNAREPGLCIINADRQLPHPGAMAALQRTGAPGSLAYIIYTSGTTGKPKGVMIEHKSLVNYISWAAQQYVPGEEADFALYTSISFDLTVTSIFTPLITGNRIIIYNEDGNDLPIDRVLADNKADVVKLTPSHLRILLERKEQAAASRVKRLIVGGEKLETWLAREVYDAWGGNIEIYNEYGPTEATVGCMIHTFDPTGLTATVPVGVPAANTRIYVLDQFLNPVPAGVHGEMYIAGDGLARGYWGKEELTREKFVADPFVAGQRMYRTGDIARRLPDGCLEYIGRADQQVKINGYRIELSEIESHLMRHEEVSEALVMMRMNNKNQPQLCAYYKSSVPAGEPIKEATLRNYLATGLPHYMIPVYFVRIERIPLTKNGKVDYSALPEPEQTGAGKENLPPQNRIEELSVKIWEEVLGEKDVHIDDNFFELGGDSIKAVQVASRLFNKGISLDVKDILTYQTIEQISLRAEITHATSNYEQGIVRGEKGLSPIEAWFFGHQFKNPNYYNQSVLLKLNEKPDKALLAEAFQKLVEHHDGLRINHNPAAKDLYYNNRHLEERFVIETYVGEPAGYAPFGELKNSLDLTRSLLIKAAFIQAAEASELLFITAHHLVMDGISWRILLEDLCTAYGALERGEAIRLPRKTATLLDWERKLAEYARSEELKAEADYWNQIDCTPFAIPQDLETNDWKVENLGKITRSLNKEYTAFLLKEAHRTYKTDVPILLNTSLASALSEWTGQNRFVIEQENHGRHLDGIDASRTIGWFTSMYPVVLELADNATGSRIKAVKEQLRSVPRNGIGYGIRTFNGKEPQNNAIKLTEIRFNYLGQFDQQLNNHFFTFSDQATGSDADPANAITAKLEINCLIVNGELRLEVNYNRKAHLESTVSRLAEAMLSHTKGILQHIEQERDVHFTPSDFDVVDLNQEELDELFL